MRRRKRHSPHANHERWLVSYADFITLLFAFFVVLYSAAQVDKKKVGQLAEAIQVAFQQMGVFPPAGVAIPPAEVAIPPQITQAVPINKSELPPPQLKAPQNNELDDLRKELEQALQSEIARGEVALRSEPTGLVISLREAGFFDSGSAGIKGGSQPAFGRMASLLADRKLRIRIEGHTDNVPIHTAQFASNWELSTARATETVRRLITQYQFPPEQLSAAGYAQYHPIASNDTEAGRALNRRVDIVILGKQAAAALSPAASDAPPSSP